MRSSHHKKPNQKHLLLVQGPCRTHKITNNTTRTGGKMLPNATKHQQPNNKTSPPLPSLFYQTGRHHGGGRCVIGLLTGFLILHCTHLFLHIQTLQNAIDASNHGCQFPTMMNTPANNVGTSSKSSVITSSPNLLQKQLLPAKQPSIHTTTSEGSDRPHLQELQIAERPSVYVMIPSIPRHNDMDYLLQTLERIYQEFPDDSRVYVFHNQGASENTSMANHVRFEEARSLFPQMHFVLNTEPVPAGHPASYDASLPLPDVIRDHQDAHVALARQDGPTRIAWRQKECHDFTVMGRFMLQQIAQEQEKQQFPALFNDTWIIFNQDDAVWQTTFRQIYQSLHMTKTPRVDLFKHGLVSTAFRAPYLQELLEYAVDWCDFKPVDWMVWDFFESKGYCDKCEIMPFGSVNHIGSISSRAGRVAAEEERLWALKTQSLGSQPQSFGEPPDELRSKLMV